MVTGPADLRPRGLSLPDVDALAPRMLGIDERRHWSMFDIEGLGDWLFARPLPWRLGVQVVAIDPSAAFRLTWLTGCGLEVMRGSDLR